METKSINNIPESFMLSQLKKKGYTPIKHHFGEYDKVRHNELEPKLEMAIVIDGHYLRIEEAFKKACSFEMRRAIIQFSNK